MKDGDTFTLVVTFEVTLSTYLDEVPEDMIVEIVCWDDMLMDRTEIAVDDLNLIFDSCTVSIKK
mgnify:CR=1 FL=1